MSLMAARITEQLSHAMGFRAELISGFVDEEFDDLMHTKSSEAWAQEIIYNKHLFLEYGRAASDSRQIQRNTGVAPARVPSYTVASGFSQAFPGMDNEPGHTLL